MTDSAMAQAIDMAVSQDLDAFIRWCGNDASAETLDQLYSAFKVREHRYWQELSRDNRCRLLYNRILGDRQGCRQFSGDALSQAMDAHQSLWREYYDDYRHASPGDWLKLVLAVNDTLQQHGHEGVWGGSVTFAKVEEGFSYRNLYHDDADIAWEEEFYSLLYGWW